VTTKPCASSTTPQPRSHSVSGSAPTNTNRLRTRFAASAPVRLSPGNGPHQHRAARAHRRTRSCLFLWDSHGSAQFLIVRCGPAGSATRANITLKSRRHVPFTGATIIIRLANIVLRASAVVALAHTLLDVADARHQASDRQTRSPPRDATSNVRWAV